MQKDKICAAVIGGRKKIAQYIIHESAEIAFKVWDESDCGVSIGIDKAEGTDVSALMLGVKKDAKAIIIGAGNVDTSTIDAILAERGLKHSEVLLVGDIACHAQISEKSLDDLVSMRVKEVEEMLSLEELEVKLLKRDMKPVRNLEKEISQQGWKHRNKYKR